MFDPKASKYINFRSIKKILIVRLGKIGDVIVTSFVFEVLKKEYPQIELHLLTLESNKDVLKYNPCLTNVIYVKKNIFLYLRISMLRYKSYDMILDFNDNPSTTSAIVFKCIKARVKAGYDFPKYHNSINFKISPLEKEHSHIIERMKNFLNQLGIAINEKLVKPYFYIGTDEMNKDSKELRFKSGGRQVIAINLSAGAKIRYWEIEKWTQLLKAISNFQNDFIFLLLSTKEDLVMKDQLAILVGSEKCIEGNFSSIQHFAAYIKSSKLIITPDTSAVHIASAFSVPTLALYPNPDWNYISWQPYKVAHRSIKSATENINGITVDEVFTNFKMLINEIGLL